MSLDSNKDRERGKLGRNDGELHLGSVDSEVPVRWALSWRYKMDL